MAAPNKKKTVKPKAKGKKEVKQNPFELKFNKVKHNVLGRKLAKHEIGNITASKKKAHEKRLETLGVEMKTFRKTNKIVDRRVGQKDLSKTEEEKDSLRFTVERLRNFKEASKFNLGDDDDDEEMTLTHGGHALTDIQRYDRVAREEDDDDAGYLAADLVRDAHFGGGEEGFRSRKDAVAELIAKTKQARHDKVLAKDELDALTESVDQKFKSLLSKVSGSFRPPGSNKNDMGEKDDYDKLALRLKVESDNRATPSERMRSANEIASDELNRLRDLEEQRIARMNAGKTKHSHISADDDIKIHTSVIKKKKGDFEVKFHLDGSLMNEDKVKGVSIKKVAIDSDDELSDEADDEEEELDDLVNDEEEEEGDDDDDEVENDDDDDDDEDEEEFEDEEEENEDEENDVDVKDDGSEFGMAVDETSRDEEEVIDCSIPYVFAMPNTYKAYVQLVKPYSPKQISVVHDRIVKCHHPGLKEGNKKLLAKLSLFVLRYYDEVAMNKAVNAERVALIENLIPVLYKLMKFDIEYSVRCFRALIRQHWRLRSEKDKHGAPKFGVAALMRLVPALYPSSDKWHPVCTPALTLACLTLSSAQISSLSILARQILLATLVGDFVEESKRFVPEAIAFLHGALLLAIEHDSSSERFYSNVFPVSLPHTQMLFVSEALAKNTEVSPLSLEEVFDETTELENNNLNRCRVLRALIGTIQKFRLLYASHSYSFTAVFSPILAMLKRIPIDNMPTSVSEEIEILIRSMEAECKSRSRMTQLSQVKTEKSMLKMLEPVYEWNFDPERPARAKNSSEKSKLKHVYKREMRGAIKELRKDASFIGRAQKQDIQERDRDRRQKTKRLMKGLHSQHAEWKQEQWENGPKKMRR